MSFRFIPGASVDVPPIPFAEHVELPARDSALVIVDMQNDFVHPRGRLHVAAAVETVPRIQRLLSAARRARIPVAFTQDTQVENDPEWNLWPEHCRLGSWGWQLLEELQPRPAELVCLKNRYDGFYGTWLEHFISHVWMVRKLVIVGTMSHICVLHTAASAGLRWYEPIVPANAISARTEFDQALTLHQVGTLYGGRVVRSVDDIHFVP